MAHILIAEDAPYIQQQLEKMLTRMGHTVTTAHNVSHVFQIWNDRKGEPPFDLVITDWHMPDRNDGLFVLQFLWRLRYTGPLIVYSGDPEYPHFAAFADVFSSLHWVRKGEDKLEGTINQCLTK